MPRGVSVYDEARLQGRLWQPTTIAPNLVGWWDAADLSNISTESNGVSGLLDKSGNNFHFAQATPGQQPTLNINSLNGLPSISFLNTASNVLSLTNFPTTGLTAGLTLFIVIRVRGGSSAILENDNRILLQRRPDLSANHLQSIHLPYVFFDGVFFTNTLNNWSVLALTYLPGSDAVAVNGKFIASAPSNGSFSTAATFRLGSGGSFGGTSNYFLGDVAEMLISSNTSEITRLRVESYLAWKWGLQSSLFSTHPFYNRPPLIGAI